MNFKMRSTRATIDIDHLRFQDKIPMNDKIHFD